ncbi:dTDP-4-dehydrorhamnose 3,5-epimerase family protein [Treponema putidum]|uniref:dTDP-4-dehydrorhamnose 3,5-epimerase n=1 Tax=Treponema putidum TaxID=221027 RepID=A0ABY5HTN6_9SPIR|nr:dTDP-4-dehydrorhamnose 3,5-epimerase family protein [Treponema putidum]UTY28297.1 dTDP-4-keto-6-deoxy-D-glucose epimerase [Treponema putidum]
MIIKTATEIAGLFILSNTFFSDERGSFKKVFTKNEFTDLNLEFSFKELYYSINRKDVIRGMHFQTPPHDHVKLVYVIHGAITDICLDIRKNSKTYGKYFSIELSGNDAKYLYIPRGIAHGFAARTDTAIVHYAQTSCYNKEHDCGIHYASFGYDWNIAQPIVSERDKAFPCMQTYEGVF